MGVFFYVLGHIWGNICALKNKGCIFLTVGEVFTDRYFNF